MRDCDQCAEVAHCDGRGAAYPRCPLEQDDGRARKRERAKRARRARLAVMRELGMTKVRGAQGGTYWE